MGAEYAAFIDEEAIHFLQSLDSERQRTLFAVIRSLRSNPFGEGDFQAKDATGREIQGLLVGPCCLFYWSDHAGKAVMVTEIRMADR